MAKDLSQFSESAILKSLNGIFDSAYVLDLENNTAEEIISKPELSAVYSANKGDDNQTLIHKLAEAVLAPEANDELNNFLDLSTVTERFSNKSFCFINCKGKSENWIRLLLLPVKYQNENLSQILFITYTINQEIEKEKHFQHLSETDGLTDLLNRRSYQEECDKINKTEIKNNLIIISFDLNELKSVNDTYGHEAGDEIIVGLANCLKNVFSDYGKIFRTGGDEFIAIIYTGLNELEKLLLQFDTAVANWTGNLIESFTVSKGYASKIENTDKTFRELQRIADKKMYADKNSYYRRSGKNRREERIDSAVISDILERENIGIWSIEIDEDQPPRMFVDKIMKSLLGVQDSVTPEEAYKFWYDRIHPDYYDAVNDSVEKMIVGNHAEVQYPWKHPSKGKIYVRCGGIRDPLYKKGIRLEGSHRNVTNMIHLQKDTLTDLYSREFFFDRAQEIMDEHPDLHYRYFVINIEDFKLVNEKYGAEGGDKLLRHIASQTKRCIPNLIMTGRLAADRFVCMQRPISQNSEKGLELERKLLEGIPFPNINLRYGIYYTSFDRNVKVQTMCDRANMAADSIKGSYKRKCAVYDDELQAKIHTKKNIVENMQAAIDNEEFKVYLQPKHDLKTDRTGGAEALIRWIHPKFGFMNPGEFIPIFESNGFIKNVDKYVFFKVLDILEDWQARGIPAVPISVNLSRRDFENADFAKNITKAVDRHNIPHELIHFELTESAVSDNPELVINNLREMHNAGFMIELDDFGAGYASLVTLSEIDFDVLKLDMSIVRNDDPTSKKNVLDICSKISKDMQLKSVAEGVETPEQLARIKSLGCDYVQGYYYSKPLSVEDFEKYLLKQ